MASVILAFEVADLSRIWAKMQNTALDPVKNTLYYFVPFLGAMSSKFTPISSKDPVRGLMTDQVKERILKEIDHLGQSARLSRPFNLYTSLNIAPMSYGGALSLTRPVLALPYEWLLRPHASPFGSEKPSEKLDENINLFSDNETRFLIAHEMGHLKFSDEIVKSAAKLLLIAAAIFLFVSPFGWIATASIVASAFVLYLFADRFFEGKIDLFATQVVGRAINDDFRAAQAALNVLLKIRAQNLEKRESSFFDSLCITKAGNQLLDIQHPFLTTRIRTMQQHLDSYTRNPAPLFTSC